MGAAARGASSGTGSCSGWSVGRWCQCWRETEQTGFSSDAQDGCQRPITAHKHGNKYPNPFLPYVTQSKTVPCFSLPTHYATTPSSRDAVQEFLYLYRPAHKLKQTQVQFVYSRHLVFPINSLIYSPTTFNACTVELVIWTPHLSRYQSLV